MRTTRALLIVMMATVLLLPIIPVSDGTTRNTRRLPDPTLYGTVTMAGSWTLTVGPLSCDWVYGYVTGGSGKYGDFEVTSGSDITFYLLNSAEWEHYKNNQAFSALLAYEDVVSHSFAIKLYTSDTYYWIFDNYDALMTTQTVSFNLYSDTTPPSISMNLDAGATYSGIKEITATITEDQFSIGSVELRIDGVLKKTESDSSFSYSWTTTGYSNGAHTIRITASDNVGNSGYEEVVVNVANVVTTTSTTSTTTTSRSTTTGTPQDVLSPPVTGVVLAVVLSIAAAGGGGYAFLRKKRPPQPDVHAKVLVICPFCGAKTEQGITHCQHCKAPL